MARLVVRFAPIILAAFLVASPLTAAGGGGSTVVHPPRMQLGDAPAAGYTIDSDPVSEYGFTLVSVTSLQLTVEFMSAEDGRVIGRFTIVIAVPGFGQGRFAR